MIIVDGLAFYVTLGLAVYYAFAADMSQAKAYSTERGSYGSASVQKFKAYIFLLNFQFI